MPNYVQHSFSAGEIGDNLLGRSDVDQYAAGLALADGWVITPQGPIERAPGTVYKSDLEATDVGSKAVTDWNLLPFVPSATERYQLAVKEDTILVYEDGVPVSDSWTIYRDGTLINLDLDFKYNAALPEAQADGDVTTPIYIDGPVQFETTGTLTLMPPLVADTDYWVSPSGAAGQFTVYSDAARTSVVTITGAGTGIGIPSMTRAQVTMAVDIDTDEVEPLTYSQNQRAMYIRADGDKSALKVSLLSEGVWNWSTPSWVNGPWQTANSADVLLTVTFAGGAGFDPNEIGAACTVSVASLTSATVTDFFKVSDSGKQIRVNDLLGAQGVGVITLDNFVIAGNSQTGVVERAFVDNSTLAIDALSFNFGLAWTSTNQPTEIAFAEGRLWQAAEPDRPSVITASKTLQYENYSPTDDDGTVQATSALDLAVLSKQSPSVYWIESALRTVMVGTNQGVFSIKPPGNQYGSASSEGITPTNVEVTRALGEKVGDVRPVLVGESLVTSSFSRKRIYGIEYEFTSDRYAAKDLSLLAYHLTETGIKEIDYAQDPWKTVFMRTDTGTVLTMAFDRSQELLGWAQRTIAGTGAEVMAQTVTPGDGQDNYWLIVKRTINGGPKYYLERLSTHFDSTSAAEGAVFVDSAITQTLGPSTSVTGLGHLEGETVRVLADGDDVGEHTVTSGAITLDTAATTVTVGLAYESRLQTLPVVIEDRSGSTSGRKIRVDEVKARFTRSAGGEYGRDFDTMHPIPFRDAGDLMDTATPLYTGLVEFQWEGDFDEESSIAIRNSSAYPMTIVSLHYQWTGSQR